MAGARQSEAIDFTKLAGARVLIVEDIVMVLALVLIPALAHIGDATLTFTPSINYTSKVFYSPYNTLDGNGPLSQPANTKINAQLSYENDNRFVKIWAKNLGNKETYGDGLDLRSFGYYYLVPAAPRTWGISAGYRF